jgi:pimeloyl-[acyl-carrier protein] methyl ester esterase
MGLLTVSEGRDVYFEDHAGPGLPVLLIHGWGMSCRVWDSTLVALERGGHRVVAFDQRGCGNSDKDFREVSVESSGADAVAVLRHLGIRRAAVNGWSLGGAVAVEAARRLGPDCAGVILTGGASPRYVQAPDFPHGNPPGSPVESVNALQLDRTNFFDGLTKAVCAIPQSDAMNAWLWSIFMQTSPAADRALAQLDSLDQRDAIRALECPLLSIVGGKDVFVAPDIGRYAAKIARRGKLAEFPDCGHAPFIEDGPRYRQVVLDFLGSLG